MGSEGHDGGELTAERYDIGSSSDGFESEMESAYNEDIVDSVTGEVYVGDIEFGGFDTKRN